MMPPLVSVRVVTYNHERYIAACLEGILMQRTEFPFEVIVGEDCSTDRTREIVLAYAERYPDRIRVITSESNVGVGRNARRVLDACRGKYQAFCEGDDFWIDPSKLQKQAAFLEAHPDCPACYHNAFIVNEPQLSARLYFTSPIPERPPFEEACRRAWPMVASMIRSDVIARLPDWRFQVWCPDLVLHLWCAHYGDPGYFKDIMAVYRIHAGGVTTRMRTDPQKKLADVLRVYGEFGRETGDRHREALRPLIEREKAQFRHQRAGRLYFLAHPSKVFHRLKEYASWIERERKLFE